MILTAEFLKALEKTLFHFFCQPTMPTLKKMKEYFVHWQKIELKNLSVGKNTKRWLFVKSDTVSSLQGAYRIA